MQVARGIDVWPCLVDLAVDDEAGRIDRQLTTVDAVAVLVHAHHVRNLDHAEVNRVGVYPERVRLHGVAHRDVS